uniref:hypothetical protein n=1 Tax=Amycolatopsis sp. CA-290885 TaxID=3239925 RepID=UPI003F4996E2
MLSAVSVMWAVVLAAAVAAAAWRSLWGSSAVRRDAYRVLLVLVGAGSAVLTPVLADLAALP